MTIAERIDALSPAQQARLARQPAAERERALAALEYLAWAERQPVPRSHAPQPAAGERPDVRGLGHRGDGSGTYWPEET